MTMMLKKVLMMMLLKRVLNTVRDRDAEAIAEGCSSHKGDKLAS